MSITFTTVPAKTLYQPLLSTDVTFKLADITGFSGSNLTAADFGTVGYGVILNSDRSVMELFSWDPTTIASTSISFVARGLPFTGSGASVTAYKLDWPAGSTVLLGSDTPQIIQYLKDYIDAAVVAQGIPASDTVPGISIEATQTQVDAGTTQESYLGIPYDLFIRPDTLRAKKYHDYAVDASGTDAYAITVTPAITSYTAGQKFSFKAGTANTGACTLNVCGLGAKTIKKDVSSDLATGDILANQIVEVEYDGVNMQMVSTVPTPHNTFPIDIQTFLVSGTWAKPSGTPKFVYIQAWGGGGSGGKQNSPGGGGGAYTERWISASSLSATETVTIGAGGVAKTTNGNGNNGGNTTFGTFLTAYGGGGGEIGGSAVGGGGGGALGSAPGPAGSGAGGAPIADTTAGLTNTGNGGGNGHSNGNGGSSFNGGGGGGGIGASDSGGISFNGGGGGGGYQGGAGGTSVNGGNGGAGGNSSSGVDGSVPGGGGGGTHTGATSGAGGNGKIIVTTFY